MERESWKNVGLVGAAVMALGCGGIWVFRGDKEPVQTVAPPPRPVRVATATPVTPIKSKPTNSVAVAPEDKRVRPPYRPETNGGRKEHSAPNATVVKTKPKPAG